MAKKPAKKIASKPKNPTGTVKIDKKSLETALEFAKRQIRSLKSEVRELELENKRLQKNWAAANRVSADRSIEIGLAEERIKKTTSSAESIELAFTYAKQEAQDLQRKIGNLVAELSAAKITLAERAEALSKLAGELKNKTEDYKRVKELISEEIKANREKSAVIKAFENLIARRMGIKSKK